MALDGLVIANLINDLNQTIKGCRISKIAQPETDELLFTFKGSFGQIRLSISASASLPLMYLTEKNKQSPMTAPNFCMLLRKHIANGRIVDITQPGLERIIVFHIEHLDDLGDLRTKKLIVELMGKHSNIIFCDDKDMIIDSIKHISAQVSSVREVLPGRTYFIPETMQKADPLSCSEDVFVQMILEKPMNLSKAIYASFTGISPLIANECCYRAGLDGDAPSAACTRSDLEKLYIHFCSILGTVSTGEYQPCIIKKGNEPVEFSSVALASYSDCELVPYNTISTVLECYYAEKSVYTRIRQKSSDLRRIVTTAFERNHKKYQLQLKQLDDTNKRDKYRIYGELLQTYGYNLDPDARFLECINYYDNQPVKIPLDTDLTPQENAQKYFDKYGKLKRTYEALNELIVETKSDIDHLDSILTAMDIATSEADLAMIKEELVESGYIKRKSGSKKSTVKSKPYHYQTKDGYEIYVGKNNFQNDELTFKFAEGNDWWFHAKHMPGSHVIVRTKTGDIPDHVFDDAAALAAYYSKGRGHDKVEIDYIQKKHIKKPNGSKPGFVVYYTNYSLNIAPSIENVILISE
ncbi:MAG: NFACT family protein [Eubacterium sp.]|nr:NFACT family protein [Eubacterium sp.]